MRTIRTAHQIHYTMTDHYHVPQLTERNIVHAKRISLVCVSISVSAMQQLLSPNNDISYYVCALASVCAGAVTRSTAKENYMRERAVVSQSPQAHYVGSVLTFGALPGLSLRLWRICMSTIDRYQRA